MGDYFERPTSATSVFSWVHSIFEKANDEVKEIKVDIGPEWLADKLRVTVGMEKYWLFDVMDSKSRFPLSAYLSK